MMGSGMEHGAMEHGEMQHRCAHAAERRRHSLSEPSCWQ
jgi:hypothetical protein